MIGKSQNKELNYEFARKFKCEVVEPVDLKDISTFKSMKGFIGSFYSSGNVYSITDITDIDNLKKQVNKLNEDIRDKKIFNIRPYALKVLNEILACKSAVCEKNYEKFFFETVEKYRLYPRQTAKFVVGSTLLLKGLEADICIILNPSGLDSKNLYVAMTRAKEKLYLCV